MQYFFYKNYNCTAFQYNASKASHKSDKVDAKATITECS